MHLAMHDRNAGQDRHARVEGLGSDGCVRLGAVSYERGTTVLMGEVPLFLWERYPCSYERGTPFLMSEVPLFL